MVRLTSSPSGSQPPDECSPAALHSGWGGVAWVHVYVVCSIYDEPCEC